MSETLFELARCSARVRRVAPGLFVVTLAGDVNEELFEKLHAAVTEDPVDATGGQTLFFDATGLTGFAPAFRRRMMAWQEEARGRQLQIVLVKSGWLATVISTASRIVGVPITITADRARWDRLLVDAEQGRAGDKPGAVSSRLPRL